jgi:hypothetical protein
MTKQRAAWVSGSVAVLCILVLLAIWVVGWRRASAGGAGYHGQMTTLDDAYSMGADVRKKMRAHKIRPSEARCAAFYRATVASELGSPELEAEVEPFYVSGCMAWKKPR